MRPAYKPNILLCLINARRHQGCGWSLTGQLSHIVVQWCYQNMEGRASFMKFRGIESIVVGGLKQQEQEEELGGMLQ